LEACDGVIVRAETVDAFEGREVKDDDSTVGAAGDEAVVGELELAYEGGVTLEEDDAVAAIGSARNHHLQPSGYEDEMGLVLRLEERRLTP
jgi:hypothetical protein